MLEIFLQNVFLVQIWMLLSLYWIGVGNFPTKCRKISYRWILVQENFLHTSVKCCTSAGKFPAYTVKIWIFLLSAGKMIPTLQPPNTGALSHWLSFLISFGTCHMSWGLKSGRQAFVHLIACDWWTWCLHNIICTSI